LDGVILQKEKYQQSEEGEEHVDAIQLEDAKDELKDKVNFSDVNGNTGNDCKQVSQTGVCTWPGPQQLPGVADWLGQQSTNCKSERKPPGHRQFRGPIRR